jgi:protein deglycase
VDIEDRLAHSKPRRAMSTITAILPLAEGTEEMEAVILIDVLRRADIEVSVLGLDDQDSVKASRGVVLGCEGQLTGEEEADVLLLPGGVAGAKRLAEDPRVQSILQRFAKDEKWIGAICAAPIALATAGLLAGRTVTSHPSVKDEIVAAGANYTENAVEVDIAGKLVTGRGPGAAFDFALDLVGLLMGAAKAAEVRRPMMFPIDG